MSQARSSDLKPELKKLFDAALTVRKNAYAPYSHYLVGAAVLMENGRIYTGCNVENSSYGGTICSERVAICSAVADGARKIQEILIVTDADPAWPPCGLCRQVIAEFGPDCTVHLATLQGKVTSRPFSELFPEAFSPAHLKR